MIRTVIATAALMAGLLTQTAAQLTPADAAPFVGDWTLAMQGPDGPATFDLTVKVEKDKMVAEMKSERMALQPITDLSKADKSLYLRYTFDYQGNPVPTVVSLTPADGGRITAQIDFAGGAYVLAGTATRKEKAK